MSATPEQIAEHARLTDIANEVKALLEKHQVTGFLSLGSQTMGHFLYHLEAPWSAAEIQEEKVRVVCTKEQGYSADEIKKRVTETIQMFAIHMQNSTQCGKNMMALLLELSNKFNIMNVIQPHDETEQEQPESKN